MIRLSESAAVAETVINEPVPFSEPDVESLDTERFESGELE